jgi:chromosome segregation ATPase
MKEYIDSLENENNEKDNKINTEIKDSKIRLKDLEGVLTNKDEVLKKLNIEIEFTKNNLSAEKEKNKNHENNLKQKISYIAELEENVKQLGSEINSMDDIIKQLEIENTRLVQNLEEVNKNLQTVEKENFDLLKRNKNLLVSQENLQSDMLRQTQVKVFNSAFTKPGF